ncbi:MAG: flagellar biosynthesis anti-sigma factor FlgM [Thermodesulfobacteriota bacterium]
MKVNDYITGTKPGAYTQEPLAEAQERKPKAPAGQPAEPETGDRVQLSERSREIARVRELVNAAPEVRTDKVAEIKARLKAGTYDVKAEKVADALIKHTLDETV